MKIISSLELLMLIWWWSLVAAVGVVRPAFVLSTSSSAGRDQRSSQFSSSPLGLLSTSFIHTRNVNLRERVGNYLLNQAPGRIRKPAIMLMMDPFADSTIIMMVASAAAAGAVVGLGSQQPRIQQLERELEEATKKLAESESIMQSKLHELEDKLFDMDQEFEKQTARFKKNYDTQMKDELAKVADKLKQEYQYKLDIKLDQQRSTLLLKQLDKVNDITNQEEKLVLVRIEKERVEDANRKLERALAEAQEEIARIQSGRKGEKGGFLWFR